MPACLAVSFIFVCVHAYSKTCMCSMRDQSGNCPATRGQTHVAPLASSDTNILIPVLFSCLRKEKCIFIYSVISDNF